MNYGMVEGRGQPGSRTGSFGIGGGVAGPDGLRRTRVTFYVAVPDVEAALAKAESLGGSRVMGPQKVKDEVELGQFKDPEGNLIGLVKDGS